MSFGKLHWRNFLVSFLVDARGGAMRGCRHSGVRLIVPPRRAAAPTRVTCRYLRKDKLSHPPPLMEGEALASRILELGPVGAKFLGPVMIEVPHFASLRGTEREIVILRSDNGEAWREHTVEASEEVVQEILSHSYEKDDMPPPVEADPSRLTRILTLDFPHYFAVVSRVKQEVHAIGPEGGMVSSSVVPQVQAVFPQGALTKKIKVGLQAQPIPTDITAKLLGNRVAVSPIVTIEPRRRKFHKPITLTIPVPQAANKGMINQYSGDAPTLRLLCSITGGTARAQWEDVTGTTPLTFVKDCVSFTTTVSARFWLMDCRNVQDSAKMATELYREAIHVPFLAKFVVFAKRIEQLEARLRVFCMTDDKEDKTLEHQEHFTEVAKSRDVEVLEGKCQFVEFAGNLVPVTKSGDQLRLGFRAFRENRLPFTVRVKDPHADVIGRTLFMREPKVSKGEAPQQPICVLNIVLPEEIIPETTVPDSELTRYQYLTHSSGLESYQRTELRLSDISNLLENDWIPLASNLGISNSDISKIESDHAGNEAQQAMAMLKLWMKQSSNRPSAATLESGLVYIGREDIIRQCIHSGDQSTDYPDSISSTFRTTEFVQDPRGHSTNIKDTDRDSRKLFDHAEIKESNIIEEPSKPVAEHRREIEKRLSQERSSSLEKTEKKSEELKMRTKITENVTLTETVAKDEPQLSFHDKRLSFERGNSQDRAKTDIFIQEEKKSLVITSSPLDTVEVKVDEAAKLSFKEKRKSFEQGSIEKSDKDDKKPKSDTKKVDEKIIEFRDELMSVPKHDKITENKHVSETLSKTVETTGDKKSIVSEKLTKTTEIKSDEKPITTELSRTTDQVERVEKPVVSEKKTKIIEEKDIVIIPGAIDTVEKLVSKPDVNETIETSFKVDPTYDMKAKIKTSKDDSVVCETITVMTDSKPIDEITVSVGSPKEKSGVSETVTTLTTGDNITKEIINIEISNKNPVISETITTVIYDSKPTKELTKDKPVVGESTITVIPDAKPQTDINRTAVNEVITSVTTDKKPTEQAKAFEEIAEKIFKAESKETEPIVFSSTGDKFDSRAVVTDEVSTKTDSKPPDQIKEIKETTKPLTIETVTTVKAGENPLVSGTITSVTATSKPTEEITTLSKSLKPAPEKESRIEEVAIKDTTEKNSKDKSTGDLQNILKDGIQTTDSCIISEMITTKKMEGAPSETKTVTEITKKFSEKGKPDQQTVITEINTGKPDMSLEERRKSELFEGVTQGLLANVKNQEPKSKDIISPKLINTPPPSPADFKDATSVSSPTTDPSWTSSTTLTDKTAIFIESERGPKTTDKPLQDSYKESKTSISVLNDQSECSPVLTEMRQESQELSLPNILNESLDQTIDNLSEIEEESQDYKKRKAFWEQLSSTASSIEKEVVPTPKPRFSVTSVSTEGDTLSSDIDKTKTLVTSLEVHTKEILPLVITTSAPTTTTHVVQETTRNTFSRENTRGESLDSEMEYIAKHPDSLAFENSCFTYEDDDETLLQSARMYDKRYSECLNEIPPVPCPRKTILERSTSLPCADLVTKDSQVKQKKKIFEAQMRKETAVEQLEEEGSPERKSISLDQSLASPDQEAILNRQIHSHIFTNEMDEQIDSLVPEDKIIRESADIKRLTEFFESRSIESKESLEKTDSQESADDPPRSRIAEVMLYKSESISKPSDSLEVQIDKSDVDSTMKEEELDEDIREIEHELQKNIIEEIRNKDPEKDSAMSDQRMLTKDNIALVSSETSRENSFNDNGHPCLRQKYSTEEKVSHLMSEVKASENIHSTIHTPEEHIPDTVWEVGIQSGGIDMTLSNVMPQLSIGKEVFMDNEEEYAEEFSFSKPVTIEKENLVDPKNTNLLKNKFDASIIREIKVDDLMYPDTLESQITEKSELKNLTKEEARNIAESVVDEIEQELVKRKDIMAHIEDQVFSSTLPVTNISDTYLKEFAEKENMDIKLIESVLAKKQRDQFKKLVRNDTATSSMEITDEDLRSSGLETEITGESLAYRMSGIIETDDEEDLPKLEKSWNDDFDGLKNSKEYFKETTETNFEATFKPTEMKEFEYRRTEENKEDDNKERVLYEANIFEKKIGNEDLLKNKKESSMILERDTNAFRKDVVHTDLLKNDTTQHNIDVHEKLEHTDGDIYITDHKEGSSVHIKKEKEKKLENIIDEKTETSDYSETKTQHDVCKDWQSDVTDLFEFGHTFQKESDTETLSKVDTKTKKDIIDEGETSYKTQTESIIDRGTQKLISSSNVEKSHSEKTYKTEILDHSRTECKIEIRKEYLGDASMIEELEKAGFRISEDIREETSRLVKNETLNKEKKIISKTDYLVKDTKNIESFATNDSDDTKSSSTDVTVVSIKQPSTARISEYELSPLGKEDYLKSPSSADIERTIEKEVILRKHDTSIKADRRSGADYDQHSSSDGSHYHSSEQISEKSSKPSRPCSADVDTLIATGGSSEYESAISHVSGKTSQTTNEYQTAASSLSSRESMKSLDSESSGNLASISETLIPSASDLDQDMDIDSIPEDKCSYQQTLEPYDTDILAHKIRGGFPHIPHSSSQPFKTEDHMRPTLTKSHTDGTLEQPSCQMKRSPEIALVTDNSPISESMDEKCSSSLDDGVSISASDATGKRTVIELSKTESERMEESATSDQHSLTVSATSGELSLSSESRDENIATQDAIVHISTDTTMRTLDDPKSRIILTSSTDDGSLMSASIISNNEQTTLIEQQLETDMKRKHGHKRNESQSFNSMIPCFTGHKKSSPEDVAESDKYDIEESEIDETDSEADQGLYRDIKEAHILKQALFEEEKSRSNLPSFSSDDYNEEIINQLISAETHITVDEIIPRPKTPEPPDDLSIHFKTSFLTKCDSISTCSSSDAFVCDIVSSVTERHLSSASDHEDELAEAEAAFHMVPHISPAIPTHLPPTIPEDPFEENKELETREALLKEATMRKLAQADISPAFIPDITVTEHLTPLIDKDFKYPDLDLEAELAKQMATTDTSASISSTVTSKTHTILEKDNAITESVKDRIDLKSLDGTTKDKENEVDSPTSDSFEMLETPDEMDDFVIVEEVAKEAEEKDNEGKSVQISKKRSVSKFDDDSIISPPKQPKTKMIKVEYYGENSEHTDEIGPFHLEDDPEKSLEQKKAHTFEDSSQESSPPTDDEHMYDKDAEARRKWIEMQFQGDPTIAAAYGYEMEFERGPLEDIKEEELTELESSSKFGSVSSQVSQSIGSIGSVGKFSLSSTPDFDILAGKKFFIRTGSEQDNVSVSSLQEFERLEQLMALESMKARSSGSQDSMNSSGRSTSSAKKSSNSGGELTSSSLKEFEGLERACIEAEKIEHKARAEELLLIEEGHESLTSESSSCVTITGPAKIDVDSDSENYEKRMFAIDEIIREAQSNVEQFADIKTESIGRGDSLEEVARIPDLEFDQPSATKKETKMKESEDDMVTSTDSLELKTAMSRKELTTSTDSLEMKTNTGDLMSASTDSIEYHLKQKKDSKSHDFMKDSIEGTLPSLEDKLRYSDYAEDQSSSSGKDGDLSSSGKEEASGEINRIPPPRSEQHLGSNDSIDPTSSTATHATYQYETDSLMSSSFTSGGSNTLMSSMETLDNVTRTGVWFEDGRPYVTEVIEPVSDDEFSHTIHRTVELPPEVHKVTFSGPNAGEALKEYVDRFGPGEDVSETKEIDSEGNVHIKRVVQRRVVVKPEDINSSEGQISSSEVEQYLKKLGQDQRQEPVYYELDHDITETFPKSHPLKSSTSSTQGLTTEFENRDEPSSSQGYRKKKEESSEVDIKKSNDAPKK